MAVQTCAAVAPQGCHAARSSRGAAPPAASRARAALQRQWPAQQTWLRSCRPPQRRRCRQRPGGVAVAARDPYDLLGVSRSASVDEIKKAFRKRALKLHPDVNKAPDARERFMEAKEAYQQLLDEKEGRAGGRAGAGTASGFGGAGGRAGGGWGGGYSSSSSAGSSYGQGQRQYRPPEPDYTFGDMLRDLDKEMSDFVRERQRKRAERAAAGGGAARARGPGAPQSLWEELYDIGEEFVEFLEQNLNVSDDEAAAYSTLKREYGDLYDDLMGNKRGTTSGKAASSSGGGSGSGGGTASTSAGSSSRGTAGSSAAGPSATSSSSRPSGTAAGSSTNGSSGSGGSSSSAGARSGRSMADAFGSSSSRAGSGSGGSRPGRSPNMSTADWDVEDELEALKRKMGKK